MSTRSSKVSSPAVAELIKELTDRWPRPKKDAAQLKFYVEDIGAMVEEFGLSRMQAALATARRGRLNFLPEPAELRDLLPSADPFAQHRDPDCRECLGSGWKTEEVPADPRHRKLHPAAETMRVSERCHCEPPPAARNEESLEVENVG
jgi:hypothetical protein